MDIQICPTRKGEGEVAFREEGHNPDKIYAKCNRCNGSGRILTRNYHIELPYGTDLSETGYYKLDANIIESILKYKKDIGCQQ